MSKIIQPASLLLIVVIGLLSVPAQATYLHNIFDSGGTQIGTLGFETLVGEYLEPPVLNVSQADLTIGGVDFTLSELMFATWEIDYLDTGSLGALIGWKSPTYGVWSGYSFYAFEGEFVLYGYGETEECKQDPGCLEEQAAILSAPRGMVISAAAPEPATIVLACLGLAGISLSRKRLDA